MAVKSGMQKIVALSVTEAELIALVMCVQEMLYVKKIIESLQLKVKLPMIVEVDNKGAVDLVNGWSVSGNTKHSQVRTMFLRELKESGVLKIQWISTQLNEADIFTKNVDGQTFKKHVPKFCGYDQYMKEYKHQSKEGYQREKYRSSTCGKEYSNVCVCSACKDRQKGRTETYKNRWSRQKRQSRRPSAYHKYGHTERGGWVEARHDTSNQNRYKVKDIKQKKQMF